MKITKSKLTQIIKETLQEEWKAGEGKLPTVDELAEWYWKAMMTGKEAFLNQDLFSVWIPLAKGKDLKSIEIPEWTVAEFVKKMDASNVRHYAQGVQSALERFPRAFLYVLMSLRPRLLFGLVHGYVLLVVKSYVVVFYSP